MGPNRSNIFDYLCDQDSHEMIALKNEADLSINKNVDLKSNINKDSSNSYPSNGVR